MSTQAFQGRFFNDGKAAGTAFGEVTLAFYKTPYPICVVELNKRYPDASDSRALLLNIGQISGSTYQAVYNVVVNGGQQGGQYFTFTWPPAAGGDGIQALTVNPLPPVIDAPLIGNQTVPSLPGGLAPLTFVRAPLTFPSVIALGWGPSAPYYPQEPKAFFQTVCPITAASSSADALKRGITFKLSTVAGMSAPNAHDEHPPPPTDIVFQQGAWIKGDTDPQFVPNIVFWWAGASANKVSSAHVGLQVSTYPQDIATVPRGRQGIGSMSNWTAQPAGSNANFVPGQSTGTVNTAAGPKPIALPYTAPSLGGPVIIPYPPTLSNRGYPHYPVAHQNFTWASFQNSDTPSATPSEPGAIILNATPVNPASNTALLQRWKPCGKYYCEDACTINNYTCVSFSPSRTAILVPTPMTITCWATNKVMTQTSAIIKNSFIVIQSSLYGTLTYNYSTGGWPSGDGYFDHAATR